jgi:glycosyltransferase involved in cell wall biosynthesis
MGWRVTVVTIEPPAGHAVDKALLSEVSPAIEVIRVPCPQPIDWPLRIASKVWRRGRSAGEVNVGSDENDVRTDSPQPCPLMDRLNRGKHWLRRAMLVPDDCMPAYWGMVRRAVNVIRHRGVDVVMASVPAYTPWLAAVSAVRRTGVPLVVDYRDLWHGDVLRGWVGPVRDRLEQAMERWALSHCSAVVSVSDKKADRIRRDYANTAAEIPFQVIRNAFDRNELGDGVDGVGARSRDFGRLDLLYTGRLYGRRRIDPLVESLVRLVTRGVIDRRRVRLSIVGGVEDSQRRDIEGILAAAGLAELVSFEGYMTRRDALSRQAAADALVVVIDEGETSEGVVPGKLSEYMGMGRFVLGVGAVGEAAELIDRYGHGAFASGSEMDEVVAGVWRRWTASGLEAEGVARSPFPDAREAAVALEGVLNEAMDRRAALQGNGGETLTKSPAIVAS